LKAGKVIPDAQPEVFDQAPSIVRVDAGGGFSPLAFQAGLPVLVQKTELMALPRSRLTGVYIFLRFGSK